MAWTNQDATALAQLLCWITRRKPYGAKEQVSDHAAKKAAATLYEHASKSGCCILPQNILRCWPTRTDGLFEDGTCSVCGCQDDSPCDGGCYWINDSRMLCSACAIKMGIVAPEVIQK